MAEPETLWPESGVIDGTDPVVVEYLAVGLHVDSWPVWRNLPAGRQAIYRAKARSILSRLAAITRGAEAVSLDG